MSKRVTVFHRFRELAGMLKSANVAALAFERRAKPSAHHRKTLGIDGDRFTWIDAP